METLFLLPNIYFFNIAFSINVCILIYCFHLKWIFNLLKTKTKKNTQSLNIKEDGPITFDFQTSYFQCTEVLQIIGFYKLRIKIESLSGYLFVLYAFLEKKKKRLINNHSVCYGKQQSFHTTVNHTVRAFIEASASFGIKMLNTTENQILNFSREI